MGNRPEGEVRRRQDAIKSFLWKEVDRAEIIDAIIASNLPGSGPPLHTPDPPRKGKPPLSMREIMTACGKPVEPPPTDEERKRAAQFRESVRRTVVNDLVAIAEPISAKEATMLPIAREVFIEQMADLYRTGRKRFDSVSVDPRLSAAGGEIAFKAANAIATVRKVDVRGTKKIEIDIGERLAKASRARIAEKWRRIREENPTIPNKPSKLIVDVKREQPKPPPTNDDETTN